jgi:hypothetical protein
VEKAASNKGTARGENISQFFALACKVLEKNIA